MAKQHDIPAEDLEIRIKAASDPRHEERLRFVRQTYDGVTVPEAAEAVG